MITGCKVLSLLEATHIRLYKTSADNNPDNGLLLRTDIHTLFDLNLVGIEPVSLKIHVKPEAQRDGYEKFHGKKLKGCTEKTRPGKTALELRWSQFQKNSI